MQITVTLTNAEIQFLKAMVAEQRNLTGREWSTEDAIHECIRMAMYEESEEARG